MLADFPMYSSRIAGRPHCVSDCDWSKASTESYGMAEVAVADQPQQLKQGTTLSRRRKLQNKLRGKTGADYRTVGLLMAPWRLPSARHGSFSLFDWSWPLGRRCSG